MQTSSGRMIAWLVGVAQLLAMSLGSPARGESPEPFRYSRPLTLGDIADDEIVAFRLDSHLFEHTRASYPDVRVFDERSQEVPFQLTAAQELQELRCQSRHDLQVVSLREQGTSIELELHAAEGRATDGLTFQSPQRDFERSVSVLGSADGVEWSSLVTDAVLFDYTRYLDLRRLDVELPANNYTRFKVVIREATDERESTLKQLTRTLRDGKEQERSESTIVEKRSFRIERIEGWKTTVERRLRRPVTTSYKLKSVDVSEDQGRKQTLITVTTGREPITRLRLVTASRNFSRRVRVEVPVTRGVQTQWREIGAGTISSVAFRNYRHESLSIDLPETRETSYRIVIENDDNPPLKIDDVETTGTVYQGVFLTGKNRAYRVAYDSETANSPIYETPVVLSALAREEFKPVAALLGEPAEASNAANSQAISVKSLVNNWFFLGTVLIMMVFALSWSLYRASQRLAIEETSK
jgi:hypothetical protein